MCLLLFGIVSPVQAAAPDEVLREMMVKIKLRGNASPLVDYVHWDEAFAALSDVQRKQLKVTNASELKEFYREMLTDPIPRVKKQYEARLPATPPEKKPDLERYYSQVIARLTREQADMKQRLEQTAYEVSAPKVEGASAIVMLKQTYQGKSTSEEVRMVKSGDTWLLPSVSAVTPVDKGPQRAKDKS